MRSKQSRSKRVDKLKGTNGFNVSCAILYIKLQARRCGAFSLFCSFGQHYMQQVYLTLSFLLSDIHN